MPMRHRDRATANGRIHPRDPGQLAVRTAHDQPLIIRHTRSGGVVGWTTISAASPRNSSCALSLRSCAPRHEHQRSRLPQRVQVVDEKEGSRRPAAQPLDVPVHPRRSFRYMERGLTVKQIASGRGSGVPYIRDGWNKAGPWSQ